MSTCMSCDGTGWVEAGWLGTPPDPSERERGCSDCGGTGVDEPWDEEWDPNEMEAPPEEDATPGAGGSNDDSALLQRTASSA